MTTTAKIEGINVEAMEKWLAALESGDFKQGQAALHEIRSGSEEMCCLGVASHVFTGPCDLNKFVKKWTDEYSEVFYNDNSSYLPNEVADYLGIPASHRQRQGLLSTNILVHLTPEESGRLGIYHNDERFHGVSRLNDNGFTFPEIAAIIRREFLNA